MSTLAKSVSVGLAAASVVFLVTHWWANNSPRWELERRARAEHPGATVMVTVCGPEIDVGWSKACWAAFATYVVFFTPTLLLLSAKDDRDAEMGRDFMKRYKRRNHAA